MLSLLAGLASQNTLAPSGNSNTLENLGLNAAAWALNGNAISKASNNQVDPQICSDGAGGAIIVWTDWRNGNADIYVQKINATGSTQWTTDGVAICTAAGDQTDPQLSSDGYGGAFVTWTDRRKIYLNRIFRSKIISKEKETRFRNNGFLCWCVCIFTNSGTFPNFIFLFRFLLDSVRYDKLLARL